MAQLRSPFEVEGAGANLDDVFQKISKGDYEPLPSDSFSAQLRQLVSRMLSIDPSKRPELEDVWTFTQDILKSQLQATTRQDVHSTAEDLVRRLLFLEDHVLMQPTLPPPPTDALRSLHPLFLAESLGSSRGSANASWDLAGEQKIQLGTFMSLFSWLLRLLGRPELSELIESNLELIPAPGEAAASLRKKRGSQGGRGAESSGRATPPLPPPSPSASTVRGSSPASKTRPGRTLVATTSNSSSRAATPPKEREGAAPQSLAPTPPVTPPRLNFASSHESSGYLPSSSNLLRGAGAVKKAAATIGLETEFAPVQAIALGHGRAVCSLLHDMLLRVYERIEPKTKAGLVGHIEHPAKAPNEAEADDFIQELDEKAVINASDPLPLASQHQEEDEEEDLYSFGSNQPSERTGGAGDPVSEPEPVSGIMRSQIDPVSWQQEVERVAPKLRILLTSDAKDWRTNLDEIHTSSKVISSSWPDNRTALEKVHAELRESLERLGTRERHINDRFQSLMECYRSQRKQLSEDQIRYNSRTEALSDRHNELHRIGEQLIEIKTMMDERGSDISDATPVVRIRSAIRDLTLELRGMEVRLGVLKSQSLKHELIMRVKGRSLGPEV